MSTFTISLQVLVKDEVATLLSSKERVPAWIAAVKEVTSPHFDDVHKVINRAAARRLQAGTGGGVNSENSKPAVSKL
jgi:glutathione S-transferase